jgi:uncharacterized repeat protein (TIGR01451 family)
MRNWMYRIRRRAPFAVVLCVLATATSAVAGDPCTKFFEPGTAMGQLSWHDPNDWNPIGVPGPTDVACVFSPGSYEVSVSSPVTVAGLQINAAGDGGPMVKIISTDFTLNGAGYLAGSTKLKVNGGAVLRSDSGALIEVHSKLVIEGGTVEIDIDLYGHLNWWGASSVTGVLTTDPASVIEAENPKEPAHLTIEGGFENNGDLVFNDTIEQSLTVIGGALVNSKGGTITTSEVSGSGLVTPELKADFRNDGLIDVDGVDLLLSSDGAQHQVGASGVIQIADAELEIDLSGILEVPSNFTNYGSVTVAGGGSIRVNGSAGALDVPSNFTNYGSVTVAGGGSIRVNGSAGAGESSSMGFVNLGLVDLRAGGDLTLTDATYENPSSGELIGGGTLDLTAAAAGSIFDGTLSPGASPGVFTVDGAFVEGPGAGIQIEIGGEGPGAGHDQLVVTGALTADGAVEVDLLHPYHPVGGEQYEVVLFDQFLGGFDTILLPPLQNLLVWNTVPTLQALRLDVACNGTQLGIDIAADNDPVSVGENVTYHLVVTNQSGVDATDIVVTSALPAGLVFDQLLSSPDCVGIGSTVECTNATLSAGFVWPLTVVAEAVVAGPLRNTVFVDSWECDVDPANNQAAVDVNAVLAARCDANYDLSIDSDDVLTSVEHIYGVQAAGNPDCRLGGGITADDLAATIEAGQ